MIHNWENYFDISSEYWKKLKKIYEDSESFPKKVVKDRNLHHKFPRSFSKKDGVDVDNDEDNLVSLSLADHFRVHYYLWKCSKVGYRGMMATAFVFMRKKMLKYASDETIEQLAKDYEEAMKEAYEASSKAMKGKPKTEEHKNKISKTLKGKLTGEKNPMYGKHHTAESRRKNSGAQKGKRTGEDNSFYGKKHSAVARKKMSEAHKGKHPSEDTRRKMSEARRGEKHPMYGKQHTDEAKKKMSESVKGKHWYNNGKINKQCFECPPGFVPGRIK